MKIKKLLVLLLMILVLASCSNEKQTESSSNPIVGIELFTSCHSLPETERILPTYKKADLPEDSDSYTITTIAKTLDTIDYSFSEILMRFSTEKYFVEYVSFYTRVNDAFQDFCYDNLDYVEEVTSLFTDLTFRRISKINNDNSSLLSALFCKNANIITLCFKHQDKITYEISVSPLSYIYVMPSNEVVIKDHYDNYFLANQEVDYEILRPYIDLTNYLAE